jgi:hypothetical protein
MSNPDITAIGRRANESREELIYAGFSMAQSVELAKRLTVKVEHGEAEAYTLHALLETIRLASMRLHCILVDVLEEDGEVEK